MFLEDRATITFDGSALRPENLDLLDFAFQPIVNIHTGATLGFEALLRNHEKLGFKSIQSFFDSAYDHKELYAVDLFLREKAVSKFNELPFAKKCKLFYNVDNRVFTMPDYSHGNTVKIIEKYNMHPSSICFEISEHSKITDLHETKKILNAFKDQLYKIAVDDFGTGFSGLQLLFFSEPDFIKLDRYFVGAIDKDTRKRVFISKLVNLAHVLGILVIAEGVETQEEFFAYKNMNCDFIQGYLVQKPTVKIAELFPRYEDITALARTSRRNITSDSNLIHNQLELVEPIDITSTDIFQVFEIFRKNKSRSFFPAINEFNDPLGLIMETDLKEYVYSNYGKDLLLNPGIARTLTNFVTPCPIGEINQNVESMIELFVINQPDNSNGIIITENGKYKGFLNANSLLKAVNEKNVARARDQNPLTKLPGNEVINEKISTSVAATDGSFILTYFDLDNFKPFNDNYGFRQGDRVILLFADILRKAFNLMENVFVGHIGGDDFFVAADLKDETAENWIQTAEFIIDKFRHDVLAFYKEADRENGHIIAKSRSGETVKFPLLTVSAGILHLKKDRELFSLEDVLQCFAELKKKAKSSRNGIAFCEMPACLQTLLPEINN